jgi:hypothetical protein
VKPDLPWTFGSKSERDRAVLAEVLHLRNCHKAGTDASHRASPLRVVVRPEDRPRRLNRVRALSQIIGHEIVTVGGEGTLNQVDEARNDCKEGRCATFTRQVWCLRKSNRQPAFVIRLHNIESKNKIPSIHRLYAMALIYRRSLNELLSLYGIPL